MTRLSSPANSTLQGIWIAAALFFCHVVSNLHAQSRLCLTGNAPDPSANAQLDDRYTYYDGGTFSYLFPRKLVPNKVGKPIDEPNRNGGWIPFREGVLTDGKTETVVGWPQYWVSSRGIDVYFDLGQECFIDEIEVVSSDATIRNVALWLKSPGEERETMVRTVTDRPTFATNYFPKLESPYRLTNVNASAQWVRVNGCWKGSAYPGWSEIRIWGRPMQKGDSRSPKIAAAQNNGKFIVAKPQEIPLEQVPGRAIFPIPREVKMEKGSFVLSPRARIVIAADASPRTETTARVFAEDLNEITGLDLKVQRGDSHAGGIVIQCGRPSPTGDQRENKKPEGSPVGDGLPHSTSLRVQGYQIEVSPRGVRIVGDDEQGTFYGAQSLIRWWTFTTTSSSARRSAWP